MSVVLVVEDDEDIRDQLAEIITDAGYQVITARHGREALQRLAEGSDFKVILLDLMMPIMDGWEFRVTQRNDARFSHIPVILLSAAGDLEEKARELGVAGYLPKPFR